MQQNNLRYYVKLTSQGKPVPGSMVARKSQPKGGKWVEFLSYCCPPSTTTTTTTSSTTTTTTTIA